MNSVRPAFITANRPAIVLNADRIIVLGKGEIVASGRHEDLIRHGGLYARLAALPFGAPKSIGDAAE